MRLRYEPRMPRPEEALPGRAMEMPVPPEHFVNGHRMQAPFPEDMERIVVAMGCFWAPRGCSGRRPACTPRPLATPVA